MNLTILTCLIVAVLFVTTNAKPTKDVNDAVVEIVKQKLIKFPDDLEERNAELRPPHNQTTDDDKNDEAKRILEQIEKINQAFGYVKKPTEQPKMPPILDSSQYLFPKPTYHPFHEQNHQMAGSNGETILVPSIRSFQFDADGKVIDYNVPPQKRLKASLPPLQADTNQSEVMTLPEYQAYLTKMRTQNYFRPHKVLVPAPQNTNERKKLPTHFVIPVRLYKMNKEEYLQKHAPNEYRVKGYKIVGDIDNFYGKSKLKNKTIVKTKSSPKYHLFFLPRELALNEDATEKGTQSESQNTVVREEKLTNRPYKIQANANANQNLQAGTTNTSASTQIIRKRIIPKRKKPESTNVESLATQHFPNGGIATTAATVHITPSPLGVSTTGSSSSIDKTQTIDPNINKNTFNIFHIRPTPSSNVDDNQNAENSNTNVNYIPIDSSSNTTATNTIKNVFQNLFKFPFRHETKPDAVIETTNLEAVPLQEPQKTFSFAAPHPFYTPQSNDYKWDGDISNSAAEDADSMEQVEKNIFGHHGYFQASQDTQKEAIKQGGIIIQRLKVRKGGIAIAGPGGVATAGSGGTAIVGPGGYALTHPRSLTIAGPGAKIIAIPSNVDLKDAIQRTDLRTKTFPREGKIVATGPTVYYAPPTGTTLVEV